MKEKETKEKEMKELGVDEEEYEELLNVRGFFQEVWARDERRAEEVE